MEQFSADGIRNIVRERYAKTATTEKCGCGNTEPSGCCSKPNLSGEQVSMHLGYSKEDLEKVPEGANMGLGCGNPQTIALLREGETVLDLGSGGGFDCFLAADAVGRSGRVIGIDMTPEMLAKARGNATKGGYDNVEFRLGEIEHLPVADNTADIVMSNCVINLSPEKLKVYEEIFRALKPGGRLAISDILALQELPTRYQKDVELLGACIGGAETVGKTKKWLEEVGFEEVDIHIQEESRMIIEEYLPGSGLGDYVASAAIKARKPLAENRE